jgi:hypothetical protein
MASQKNFVHVSVTLFVLGGLQANTCLVAHLVQVPVLSHLPIPHLHILRPWDTWSAPGLQRKECFLKLRFLFSVVWATKAGCASDMA